MGHRASITDDDSLGLRLLIYRPLRFFCFARSLRRFSRRSLSNSSSRCRSASATQSSEPGVA